MDNHEALKELATVMDPLGFKVHKKADKESTLRVYLRTHAGKKQPYPLLNPRFQGGAEVRSSSSYLEITVWSKGDAALDARLRRFARRNPAGVRFFPAEFDERADYVDYPPNRYRLHGWFEIPLSRRLAALRKPLLEVRRVCGPV
jgi:hypothetical protein